MSVDHQEQKNPKPSEVIFGCFLIAIIIAIFWRLILFIGVWILSFIIIAFGLVVIYYFAQGMRSFFLLFKKS